MSKLILFLCGLFFLCGIVRAQAPQAIPYQAIARNTAGDALISQNVSVRFTIHDSTLTGTAIYQESHTLATNSLGLFSLNVGQGGNNITGNFSAINWGAAPKFMQVELDPAGGTNFTDMGTSQMMSVPYALYAASAGNAATGGTPQVNADWNATTGVAEILNKPTIPVFPPAGGTSAQYINGTGGLVAFPVNVSTFTNDAGYITSTGADTNFIKNGTALQTSANFNISGAGTIGTTLNVGGNTSIGGTATVTGLTTLNGGLTETGNVSITGNVVINDPTPTPLAALDIASTTQGFLPPRMHTADRNAITATMNTSQMTAIQGLTIYNLDTGCIESFIGTNATQSLNWQPIGCGH